MKLRKSIKDTLINIFLGVLWLGVTYISVEFIRKDKFNKCEQYNSGLKKTINITEVSDIFEKKEFKRVYDGRTIDDRLYINNLWVEKTYFDKNSDGKVDFIQNEDTKFKRTETSMFYQADKEMKHFKDKYPELEATFK